MWQTFCMLTVLTGDRSLSVRTSIRGQLTEMEREQGLKVLLCKG